MREKDEKGLAESYLALSTRPIFSEKLEKSKNDEGNTLKDNILNNLHKDLKIWENHQLRKFNQSLIIN